MKKSSDVGKLLGVSTRTVNRWVDLLNVEYIRTPGGHRRIPQKSIDKIIQHARGNAGRSTSFSGPGRLAGLGRSGVFSLEGDQ